MVSSVSRRIPLVKAGHGGWLSRLARWWPEALILVAVGCAFLPTLRGSAHLPYDVEYYHYPLLRSVQELLASGTLPSWDGFTYGGVPLLSNTQSAWLYPPNLLLDGALAAVGQPLTEHLLDVVAILQVAVAGLGTAAVARGRRLGPAGAAYAGVFVVLSGETVSQTEHLGMTEAFAWLPLAILVVDRMAGGGVTARRVIALGVLVALMIGAGFTPMVPAVLVLLVGVALARERGHASALIGTVSGAVLGLVMAAVVLIPAAALLGVFPPLPDHLPLPVEPLVTTIFPNALGHWNASLFQYTGAIGGLTNSYYYLGGSAVVIAAVALTTGRAALIEGVLVIALLVMSFGATAGAIAGPIQGIPGVGPLWRPEDALYVATIPIGLLLARGLTQAPRLLGLVAVAVAVVLLAVIPFSVHDGVLHLFADAPVQVLAGLAVTASALIGAYVLRAHPSPSRSCLALAAVVGCVSLTIAVPHRYFVNASGPATAAGPVSTGDGSSVLTYLHSHLLPGERVMADVNDLQAAWAGFPSIWRLSDINGFQPQFSKYQLARVTETKVNFAASYRTFPLVPGLRPYLREMDARFVVVAATDDRFDGARGYQLVFADAQYHVYRVRGEMSRAYAVSPTCLRRSGLLGLTDCRVARSVTVDVDSSNERLLRLADSPTPSLVVTGEPWYPGWTAQTSQGSLPVTRVAYLAAVKVPPGVTAVKLSYHPPGLLVGALLSGLAIAGSALVLVAGRRPRRRSASPGGGA